MTQLPQPRIQGPAQVVASRVKELRTRRDWSAEKLAQAMQDAGIRWTRSVVANLENGRRPDVTVTELFALAHVFEVSPLVLLLPSEDGAYQVTEEDTASARTVYEWLVGELLPPFPFPLEGITDEDRARAWFVFTRLVGYVSEPSAHWLVNAELERLREEDARREDRVDVFQRQIERLQEDMRRDQAGLEERVLQRVRDEVTQREDRTK